MNLFSFFNGWAGHHAIFDGAMRLLYVASVPLLATLWLALLFFHSAPHAARSSHATDESIHPICHASSRRAVVIATVLSLAICGVLWLAWTWFTQNVLRTPILSPRPFVSYWANLLVVEPNDNSFPSPEAILLGVGWIACWALSPRAHWLALSLALAGSVVRVICGTHYVADVVVGLCIGAGVTALMCALCDVVLRLSTRPFRQRAWRLRAQSALSGATILGVVVFGIASLRETPRLFALWQNRHEIAQRPFIAASGTGLRAVEYSKSSQNSKTTSEKTTGEGEGTTPDTDENAPSSSSENTTDSHGKEVPRSGVTTLGGFVPREEARLLRALRNARLGHSLVSVDVAALRDRDFQMHFAAVRFQVQRSGAAERRRVARTAQRIVQTAFATNSALQNIDVTGVVLNDPQRDGVRYPIFAVGAIGVWTASVQRQNVRSKKLAAWLNAPNADAGLWLRARSKIYINERVLPARDIALPHAQSLFMGVPATSSTRTSAPSSSSQKAPRVVPIVPKSSMQKSVSKKPQNTSQQTAKRSPNLRQKTTLQKPLTQKRFRPKTAPRKTNVSKPRVPQQRVSPSGVRRSSPHVYRRNVYPRNTNRRNTNRRNTNRRTVPRRSLQRRNFQRRTSQRRTVRRNYAPRRYQPRRYQPRRYQPRRYQPRRYQPRRYQPRRYRGRGER